MSRARPGYTGTPDTFSVDVLTQTERLEMVEKLKEFYPSKLPDSWDEFTELDLAGLAGMPPPDDMKDPEERFCFYVYYSAAQEIAEYKGDELTVVTPAQAQAEVADLLKMMRRVLRILPERPTTALPCNDLQLLAENCRGASNSTISTIFTTDEIVLSSKRVDADLKYVSDVADELLDQSSTIVLNDMRALLGYFIPLLERAVETGRAEKQTSQPDEVRQRRAQARLGMAGAVSGVLNVYGLSVSTYHSEYGAEHDTHRWSGSSDLVQILCLLGKSFDVGGSGKTWSEVVRKLL